MANTIVVPLDGSEISEHSIPVARALAARTGASILLVSVVDIPVEMMAWTTANATSIGRELDEWVRERERYLQKVETTFGDLNVRTMVRTGTPTVEILAALSTVDQPIVVMSSHGRTGAGRVVLGSVANRVVRDAHCPVLVVRGDADVPTSADFQRILVPLDGSPFGEYALRRAPGLLSRGDHAALHLLRVIETPAMRVSGIDEPGFPLDYGLVGEYLDAARAEAMTYLDSLATRLREQGHDVTTEVRVGRIVEEILASTAEHQSTAIAMSTHGRAGLSRIVFGSVAEGVLHRANRPLLLLRPVS